MQWISLDKSDILIVDMHVRNYLLSILHHRVLSSVQQVTGMICMWPKIRYMPQVT